MQTNKILNKFYLPKALIVSALISAGFVAPISYYTAKESRADKQINKSDTFLLIMALVVLILWCKLETSEYKKGQNFFAYVARKYVKQAAKEHPEFKLFEKTISNQNAMKNVGTFIANSLRPSEQKRILKIMADIKKFQKYELSEKDMLAIVKEACAKIVKIIQEHESVHPGFINELYKTVAHADMTYVVPNPIQQHTR